MTERVGERRNAQDWCLGYRVPVIVTYKSGIRSDKWCGSPVTVSALNPREYKGPYKQKRGLFLDGPRHDDPEVVRVVTKGRCKLCGSEIKGKDVTKFIRISYGPAL